MNYQRRFFDPQPTTGEVSADNVAFRPKGGDPEQLYVFAPKVILAVNVALATGRPLLVSGEPGCVKSSLEKSAAAVLGWDYFSRTVTSRTQAADLFWRFDALRRLNDASTQGIELRPDRHYVEPGPLWWAFDPDTARQRGKGPALEPEAQAACPERHVEPTGSAVALIDEIDKADPDVPNDLLDPFDRKTFTVLETGDEICARRPLLMVLTTNRERTMPRAFVRRCVTLELDEPTEAWLSEIATQRYGEKPLRREIAKEVMALRAEAKQAGVREPSTAEYLDAVVAADALAFDRANEVWKEVKQALLWKSDAPFPYAKASV